MNKNVDLKKLDISVEIEVPQTVFIRLWLFKMLMRVAAWVGGFGGIEFTGYTPKGGDYRDLGEAQYTSSKPKEGE